MKLLNIILLTVFFIFICISLTSNIEKFENKENFLSTDKSDSKSLTKNKESNEELKENKENKESSEDEELKDEREKCSADDSEKELDNKKCDIITIPLKDITSDIFEHPATDTEKKLKKQVIRPININVSYNVEKEINKCDNLNVMNLDVIKIEDVGHYVTKQVIILLEL